MTCEIVAAPAAIAQMLSADRSIRGTVSAPNIIITRFERDSPLFGGFYFYYLLPPRWKVGNMDYRRIHRR